MQNPLHRIAERITRVTVAALISTGALLGNSMADPSEGRKKALQCQACHGLDGMAKIPEAPNLAGQNPQYLVKALQDFKSGARQNEMMRAVAPMLSSQDMEILADYFSNLPYIKQSADGQ